MNPNAVSRAIFVESLRKEIVKLFICKGFTSAWLYFFSLFLLLHWALALWHPPFWTTYLSWPFAPTGKFVCSPHIYGPTCWACSALCYSEVWTQRELAIFVWSELRVYKQRGCGGEMAYLCVLLIRRLWSLCTTTKNVFHLDMVLYFCVLYCINS